ncbi:MAG: PH domain-containing protein [Clostridia bacterium]|nr:PH domain-containing protein [Clostridia bacterium]
MLDFRKGTFHKYRLSEVSYSDYESDVAPLLTDKETVLSTFRAGRDGVVFTTKRLITIDRESGRKTDITSIPYSSIDLFSIENAGWMDRDAELDLCIKSVGKFRFEFDRSTSMATVCKHISICKFN